MVPDTPLDEYVMTTDQNPSNWPQHAALSRPSGEADQPRDFDWVAKNIPCQAACPAGTDIPGYLDAVAHGNFDKAYRINLRDNVFPAVLGRVCTRPCEPACRHGWEGLGEPVAICWAKRAGADWQERGQPVALKPLFRPSGKKVAVVGAGPAGLAVARELALWGHEVVVLEREEKPGGLMVLGIPPFRLPREIVEREIEQVRLTGVDIRCGVEVGQDVELDELRGEYDVVIVASGALKPRVPDVTGSSLAGIRHGLDFLHEANTKGVASVSERVMVVGGGFTAVDCARTALRLGAGEVTVCYRRSEEEMYITPGEVEEMEREGIAFKTMVAPKEYLGEQGRVAGVRFVQTELGDPDETGRRRPQEVAGSDFTEPCGCVLLATGQVRDTEWIAGDVDDRQGEGGTSVENLFVTGDFAGGSDSLIDAIAHAKTCARSVDRHLVGTDRFRDVVVIEDASSTGRTRDMDEIPRQTMPIREIDQRALRDEVETGYDQGASSTEASRCYLCHYKFEIDNDLCIYCDRCLKVMPVEHCIVKVKGLTYGEDGCIIGHTPSKGSRDYNLLYINQNECIRCGACAEVCPVECISLQKVSKCTLVSSKEQER